MIELHLTEQEIEELTFAVQSFLPDLRIEIEESENQEYRAMLEERREVLSGILEKLRRAADLWLSQCAL